MRILYIAKNIPIPTKRNNKIIFTIAEQLSKAIDVTFFYPNEYVPWGLHWLPKYRPFYQLQQWTYAGFDIYPISYKRLPLNNVAFSLFNNLKPKAIDLFQQQGSFDLIHAHFVLPDAYFAYLYHQKFNVPYIISIRKSDIKYIKTINNTSSDFKKIKTCIINANALLTLNLAQKQFIDQLFDVNCILMPHGIEQEAILENTQKKMDAAIHISVIGEAIGLKNIEWVIKAVQSYKGQHLIQLHIAGDGPLLESYKVLATGFENIHIYGRIPRQQVLELMTQSDIFALPSDNESFGLVYLEAAARQNAIIGFFEQGVWGIFTEKEMRFATNFSNFEYLLHELIKNETIRMSLTENAFEKAKQLTWKNISKKYLAIYQNIIQ